jgi:DNA-binding transcriptional regulator YdaS (Cro superfamily)
MEIMNDVRNKLPFPIEELRVRLGRKSYARLHEYVAGKVPCPAELCIQIETATDGAVKRSDLREDLWPHPSSSSDPAA